MSESDQSTEARLRALSDRLARIEDVLGLTTRGPAPQPPPQRPSPHPPAPPIAPSSAAPTRPAPVKREALGRVVAPPTPGRASRTSSRRDASSDSSLEQVIGARWFAAAGALVVIAGVSFAVKFAWDQGWIGMIHPLAKVLFGYAFGGVLLVAGEFALRRINAPASAGLSAAGIGAVYAAGYATRVTYELVTLPVGFLILAFTAALGVLLAVRARQASVGVLSLIGGYLAPLLLATGEPNHLFFTSYLVLLLIASLTLSAWQGRARPSFHSLRIVGWIGTGLLGAAWVLGEGPDQPDIALAFLVIVWIAIHTERLVASRGVFTPETPVPEDEDRTLGADLASRPPAPKLRIGGWGAAGTSFSATIWSVGLLAFVLEDSALLPTWTCTGAFTAMCLVLASVFAGHLRIIHDVPRTDAERVGAALLMQTGALLVITLALAIHGWALVLTWIALGLASIGAGRWMRSLALDWYGLVALALGTGRLLLLRALFGGTPVGRDVLGLHLTEWTGRFALTGLAWIVASALLLVRQPRATAIRSSAALAIGAAMIMLPLLHEQSQAHAVVITWLAIVAGLVGVDRVAPRMRARMHALLATAGTLLYWFVQYPPFDWADSTAPIAMHPALWLSVLIGAVGLAQVSLARWDLDAREVRPAVRAGVIVVVSVLLFGTTSLEVARGAERLASDQTVQNAVLSIYWGLCGAATLAAGFLVRIAAVRYVGLALIAVATGKTVIVDLATVPTAWRIVSFLALGLLMLAVAVVYATLSAALARRNAPSATSSSPPL